MAIASRLKWFLEVNRARYEVLPGTSGGPSSDELLTSEQLVVSRLYHDAHGYLMVVHPASRKVEKPAVEQLMGRPLQPAREKELRDIFFDCEKGFVPPLGPAYGIPTLIDDSVPMDRDLYFSSGDATDWVHMTGAEFEHLVADSQHASLSRSA